MRRDFKHLELIATYPRKGTVTDMDLLLRCDDTHCNLSPQGDGNGDTNTNCYIPGLCIATYPRKGTVTELSPRPFWEEL